MDKNKLAEFIGIMLGDGYFSNNRLKISFNSKEDLKYINYVKKLIQNLFDVEPILKFRKNENTAELFLFKRKILELLSDKGLKYSPKWDNAIIPRNFTSKKIEKYVLKGYFDTDGCLVTANNNGTIYPRLEMKVCPSPMQNQFIKILKNNNFKFGVYQIGNGKIRIQLNGKKQLKQWVDLVGFGNDKHANKINRFNLP